jgi:hypothetical protein
MADEGVMHPAELQGSQSRHRRKLWLIPVVLLGLVVLYYLLGMFWLNEIDDDPAFAAESSAPEGGSQAVALTADLIDREINTHRWVANDPFFMPGAALDNTPNFQQGIMAALSRFTIELGDQIARVRGSSQVDRDLDSASGLLKYPGTVWIFDFSTSWAPTASSESQYRRAMNALRAYNDRLATGNAVFEARADNLLGTIDRITADIGSSSASLDRHLELKAGSFIDTTADDLFYNTKGRLYAYYLLLRELGQDFRTVIEERDLENLWAQMLESLARGSSLNPWVVVNGSPDSVVRPSHLTAQGFYLLRGRTQLKEISNILLK